MRRTRRAAWMLVPCLLLAPVRDARAAIPVRTDAPALKLSPAEAVARALRANPDLIVERQAPDLTDAPARAARAPFDPVLFAEGGVQSSGPSPGPGGGAQILRSRGSGQNGLFSSTVTATANAGVRKTFVTGTQVEVGGGASTPVGDSGSAGWRPGPTAGAYLTVRQPLLRGVIPSVNQTPITTAELRQKAARQNLARKSETVALETLNAYWDLYAARKGVEVQRVALQLAEKAHLETSRLAEAGKLPRAETVATGYQVEVQRRALLNAEQLAASARDRLLLRLGLLEPGAAADDAALPEVQLSAPSTSAAPALTLEELIDSARTRRGDQEALRLEVTARAAEERAAAHQLLPKLDLGAGLGLVHQAGSSGGPGSVASQAGALITDGSLAGQASSQRLGWSVGLSLEIPLGNREAKARRDMARLERQRAEAAVARAGQQLAEEVRTAHRNAALAEKTLALTTTAARVARTKYEAELERYRAGRSSAHILSTVQAELVREELAREQARAELEKAVAALYAASGLLLERIGG